MRRASFSANRNDAVASLKNKKQESKEVKKIAKLEEKNFETKDTIKPVIKIAYNNKTFDYDILYEPELLNFLLVSGVLNSLQNVILCVLVGK